MRSRRLAELFRRFDVAPCSSEKDLRRAFFKLCKSIHPDVNPESAQHNATPTFIALRREYEEALLLLRLGYTVAPPVNSPHAGTGGITSTSTTNRWVPHLNPKQQELFRSTPSHRDDVMREFAWWTKVKGAVLVLTGLTFFFMGLREFLVATAGTIWAYKPPKAWSSFYIRRYLGNWDDDSPAVTRACLRPADGLAEPQGPSTSAFYQRRLNKTGISREQQRRRDRSMRSRPTRTQQPAGASPGTSPAGPSDEKG